MFQGTYTALITPFLEDGSLNTEALEKQIDTQILSGVDGIVLLGSTAETPTLSEKERTQVLEVAHSCIKGRIHLTVGVSSASTEQSIQWAKEAQKIGVDAIMASAPYYNCPTQEGIYHHFLQITRAVNLPVMVYNVPKRSGVNIEIETFKRLFSLNNIMAVKEASGSLLQLEELIFYLKEINREAISLLSGDDRLALPAMSLGARGVVSVLSNAYPDKIKEFIDTLLSQDFQQAKELHYILLPLFEVAFIETNPAPIKWIMNYLKKDAGPCRLPLVPLSQNHVHKVEKVLKQVEKRPLSCL